MSINDCNVIAEQRRIDHLNKQLGSNNNFSHCANCDKQFYPMYSSSFCSRKCAKEAFETLCTDCRIDKLDSHTVLEILCACPDNVDASDVRKIAALGHYLTKIFGD